MKASSPARSGEALAADLTALGIHQGQTLLVHASMRAVGPIQGGVTTAVGVLRSLLATPGTLVVPTGTSNNSDSSRVHLSRINGMTSAQRRRYRMSMPAFDIGQSPSIGMGILAETVRTTPGACRSAHPQTSFAALGARARQITENHAEDCHYGERSPLARLYDLGAWILLLGVDYRACTAFHLAEYRYQLYPQTRAYRCVVQQGSQKQWWQYRDVNLDDSDFCELGLDLDRTGIPVSGKVGNAECRLLPVRFAVDYAIAWLRHNRTSDSARNHCTPPVPYVILQANSAPWWEPVMTTE